MESWKLFLVLSLTVGAVACLDLEGSAPRPMIVCHVSIYPDISDAIQNKLDDCYHVIVSYDGLCDLAKYFLNFSDTIRIALIRGRAPHAKILRQVEVKLDENFDPILAVHNVQASLAGGLFDGVELVLDMEYLDQNEQIKYAQFLKILGQNLDDHVLISNSFVCNQQLPAYLLNAMSEVLDYVILLPSFQNASIEVSAFEPRVYSGPVANCLLGANFPRNKIVLGLPTGGKLVDSSVDRETPSNLIPYGNVCELQEEQQRHCEEQQNQDCSLFEDGEKLIYDDSNSAGRRALQCVGCKLKGVSIALSYDDPAGICVGSRFPLLSAVQNVFEYRSGVLGFNECPSDSQESDVGSNQEIQFDISSHFIENEHLDSEKEDNCSCANGKLYKGCTLRKRLQQTLKSSENVASLSKDVTDKVLGSLDRVVTLVSLMMQYRSMHPLPSGSDQVQTAEINPATLLGPSVEVEPFRKPGVDAVLTDEVGPNLPSGSDQVQTADTNPVLQPDPAGEDDPVQTSGADTILTDEVGPNSPSGSDQVPTADTNPVLQPDPAGENDPVQTSGADTILTDEVGQNLPSGSDQVETVEVDPVPKPDPAGDVDPVRKSVVDTKLTDEVEQNISRRSDQEQTAELNPGTQPGPHVEVDPIQKSGVDPKLTDEVDQNLPFGSDQVETVEVDPVQKSDVDTILTDEVELNLPSGSNQVQIDEDPQLGQASDLTNENHDLPSGPDSELALAQTAQENLNEQTEPPPGDQADGDSDPDSQHTDHGNQITPSGPDTEPIGVENPSIPTDLDEGQEDSVITVEEIKSSRSFPEYSEVGYDSPQK